MEDKICKNCGFREEFHPFENVFVRQEGRKTITATCKKFESWVPKDKINVGTKKGCGKRFYKRTYKTDLNRISELYCNGKVSCKNCKPKNHSPSSNEIKAKGVKPLQKDKPDDNSPVKREPSGVSTLSENREVNLRIFLGYFKLEVQQKDSIIDFVKIQDREFVKILNEEVMVSSWQRDELKKLAGDELYESITK